ncbi:NACHT, LRR and PYD domains-containing protein 1b allele 5 isoform X2 [Dicentrarchus labrax]|uniref:NACHT, LRR and PYD domains-containing protein 1b allele 5 isoform X2 n=1 Tax=Dicentrarchus labrax TaxID=13489 RepID=UPI0021F648F7|nr:NACHT, LRR and PYD domains-containing protein 1b allele 5 isoform X2 [Dicentrarchus labrax]
MEAGGQSLMSDSDKEHFVDKHKVELILTVQSVDPILDELLTKGVIQHESYDKIRALSTSVEKMRDLFEALEAVGVGGKDIFYNIIKKLQPHVIEEIFSPSRIVFQSAKSLPESSKRGSPFISWTSTKIVKVTRTSPKDDWIKLEPEVNYVDASIYSHQSEAGKFECSVSGLRWVCNEKISLKYQFGFWEEHKERLETMQYIAGGPLLDITVTAGKLDEVYLPHWICTDDIPSILDKFAVLHIDAYGDVVEQVSEVTPSHVKLYQPVFSPRGVLMKAGFPVKINCKVLIYKTNKAFLTLHVYLIPCDPAIQQMIKNKELSSGHKMIPKPYPVKALKMRDRFILTADTESAEIYPEKLKLAYESSDPNFFEVFIENPDSNFQLTLRHGSGPVWTSAIRKDDYGDIQVVYDKELASVRSKLVVKMSREVINQLLDDLLEDGVLNDEEKDSILHNNRADRARCLIDKVKMKGYTASRKMFTHLQSRDPTLCAELGLPYGLPV